MIQVIRCSQRALKKLQAPTPPPRTASTTARQWSAQHSFSSTAGETDTSFGPTKSLETQLNSARLQTSQQQSIITQLRQENQALWGQINKLTRMLACQKAEPAYQPLTEAVKQFLCGEAFKHSADSFATRRVAVQAEASYKLEQVCKLS